MVDIKLVGKNIHMIDDRLYFMPKWGSVYVIDEERKALIDTGPSTSSGVVLEGLRRIGIKPADVNYLVLTHIHLDHAGGAGTLLEQMPEAKVVVHERGAKHLSHPERLMQSVAQASGQEMMKKYGEMTPVTEERVQAISGDFELKLGENQALKIFDAPGHAPHEVAIYETRNRGIFVGDAVGVYVPDKNILFPATQPPNFDLELWLKTIKRIIDFNPSKIYFAHFGVADEAQRILNTAIEKLLIWDKIVKEGMDKGNLEEAAERITALSKQELAPVSSNKQLHKYLVEYSIMTSLKGFLKYYGEKYQLT